MSSFVPAILSSVMDAMGSHCLVLNIQPETNVAAQTVKREALLRDHSIPIDVYAGGHPFAGSPDTDRRLVDDC